MGSIRLLLGVGALQLLPLILLLFRVDGSSGYATAQPFGSGNEYTFAYSSQTATGMLLQGQSVSNGSSTQRAITAVKASVRIQFSGSSDTDSSPQSGKLQLNRVQFGALNQEVEDSARRLQPWSKFEEKAMPEEKLNLLMLPVEFRYSKGLITSLEFSLADKGWSKNLKKAVLNMMQLNLAKQQQDGDQLRKGDYEEDLEHSDTFTLPESTIEGKCLATYAMDQTGGKMNVSKHIHFRQCSESADVTFGFHSSGSLAVCEEECKSRRSCPKICDQGRVGKDVLDRSTVLRYKLAGDSSTEYGIQKVKLYSTYRLISPEFSYGSTTRRSDDIEGILQTSVIAELVYHSVKPISSNWDTANEEGGRGDKQEPESLMHNNAYSLREKRLYMYGDADSQVGPGRQYEKPAFHRQRHRVDQSYQLLNKIIRQSAFERTKGITSNAVVHLNELIEQLKKCSVQELEAIYQKYPENQDEQAPESLASTPAYGQQNNKARSILDDCLAAAGTRNAIFLLSKRIRNRDVPISKATFALKAMLGSTKATPSDEQAKILLELCQSSVVSANEGARHACWITAGALIHEVCRPRTERVRQQLGNDNGGMCSASNSEHYAQTLISSYKSATDNNRDKLIALKTIGNAGLVSTVSGLQEIIRSADEQFLGNKELAGTIKAHAIDALRRMRNQHPKKIGQVVLPILLNQKERSEVRVAAFWQLMGCHPLDLTTIDRIAFMLKNQERSPQVYAFIHSTWITMAKSKDFSTIHLVKHLNENILPSMPAKQAKKSRMAFLPISFTGQSISISPSAQNPFSFNVAAISSRYGFFPKFASHSLGKLPFAPQPTGDDEGPPKGHSLPDNVEVVLSQINLDKWYQRVINHLSGKNSSTTTSNGQNHLLSDMGRSKMHITGRKAPKDNGPLVIYSIRVDDVDQLTAVGDDQLWATALQQAGKSRRSDDERAGNDQWRAALSIGAKSAHVPTSSGMVLKFAHSLPTMACVQGRARVESISAASVVIKAEVQPTFTVAHVHTMEVYSPTLTTGVENIQAVESNLPIQFKLESLSPDHKGESGVRLTFDAPITPAAKVKIFSLRTLPALYIKDFNVRSQSLGEAQIQAIHHPALEPLQQQLREPMSNNPKLTLRGQFHLPAANGQQPSLARCANHKCSKQFLQMLTVSENHIHLEMGADEEDSNRGRSSPSRARRSWRSTSTQEQQRQLQITIRGRVFEKKSKEELAESLQQFTNFYANWGQVFKDNAELHPKRNPQAQLDAKVERIKARDNVYQHWQTVKVALKKKDQEEDEYVAGTVKLKADCEDTMEYCRMSAELKTVKDEKHAATASSPSFRFFGVTHKINMHLIAPEEADSIEHFQQERDANNIFLNAVALLETTTEDAQRSNGADLPTTAVNLRMRIHGESGWEEKDAGNAHQQPEEKVEEDAGRQQREMCSVVNKIYAMTDMDVKLNAMTTTGAPAGPIKMHSEMRMVINPKNGREAEVLQQYATQDGQLLPAQTVTETLPSKVELYSLIRTTPSSSESSSSTEGPTSMSQFLRSADVQSRAVCGVDGQTISTFDGAVYEGPLSNCYSILAKDCSDQLESGAQPKFVLLMRKVDQEGGIPEHKLKFITPSETVELSAIRSDSGEVSNGVVHIRLNGQDFDPSSSSSSDNPVSEVVIQYTGHDKSKVEFHCDGVHVTFNGRKAWIRLSHEHKHTQCGLCGHFDGDEQEEFRGGDNKDYGQDLGRFHRSYTMTQEDGDGMCTEEDLDKFYETARFASKQSGPQTEQEEEEDNELPQSRRQGRVDPIQVTKVKEYKHKVCFSKDQIAQCLTGSTSTVNSNQPTESGEENPSGSDNSKSVPTKFGCLDRSDPNMRQMLKVARQSWTKSAEEMSSKERDEKEWLKEEAEQLQVAFVEQIKVPTKCQWE